MAGYSEGREGKKKEKEKEKNKKMGVVYGVVPLLLPVGPIGCVEDRDVRHPWVLFVTGATCSPGQSRRGTPSRDRSWKSQTADGDAGRTGIRQHSAFLFLIMSVVVA
jgi:hypothetical protein